MFRVSQSFARSAQSSLASRAAQRVVPIALVARSQGLPAIAIQKALLSSNRPRWKERSSSTSAIDQEAERKRQQDVLQPTPGGVSSESTTRKAFEESATSSFVGKDNEDINSGLKHDINIVRDTFSLSNIPRESHILGLAGTVPYLATSLSTLYLAWDLSTKLPTGNSLLDSLFINHDTARYLVGVLEPLQLGYGAVIISFLGAVHWGLEYAEKHPSASRTRFRYGMGVAASIVAWPTLLLPIEYGLTSQFMAFVALYFADSRAAKRGWAPRWYGQYRFLLTAMVGLAIFVSLVGRTQIERSERLSQGYLSSSMKRPGIADTKTDWAKLEAEEKRRLKKEEELKARKAKQEEQKQEQQEKAQKAAAKSNGSEEQDKKDSEEGDES